MLNIPLIEWFVLAWVGLCWAGYTSFAQRKSARIPSLVESMRVYRREWFKHDAAADLPFARKESGLVWLTKIILLSAIFVNAFFKFTWSIRQYSFCVVLIGATPLTDRPNEHDDFVDAIGGVASLAAENFNHGLRAFYFALATLHLPPAVLETLRRRP